MLEKLLVPAAGFLASCIWLAIVSLSVPVPFAVGHVLLVSIVAIMWLRRRSMPRLSHELQVLERRMEAMFGVPLVSNAVCSVAPVLGLWSNVTEAITVTQLVVAVLLAHCASSLCAVTIVSWATRRPRDRFIRCAQCGYRIDNVVSGRCPECGRTFVLVPSPAPMRETPVEPLAAGEGSTPYLHPPEEQADSAPRDR